MLTITRICLLALGLLCCIAGVGAQADPYAGVPQSRTADGAFVLGSPDAAVKIIEFSDFLCPSCQRYEPVMRSLIERFVLSGQAQFEYRLFPVVDPVLSPLSAALAECADTLSPGLFWRAHDLMFEMVTGNRFSPAMSADFARELELDEPALLACAQGAAQHQTDLAYGLSLGVRGTPSLFAQYGDAPPIAIAVAGPDQMEGIVKALRPAAMDAVTIESGRYQDLTAFRRQDGGFALGSPDAPMTLIVFEDFHCPHCQRYQETLHQFIDEQARAGRAQFEFRFFPVVDPERSLTFAQLAECAGVLDPGKFWAARDWLFAYAAGPQPGADPAAELASALDLDADALNQCRHRAIQSLIDMELGRKAGVTGTPGIRARAMGGAVQLIHRGSEPLNRGSIPLELLTALAEGAPELSIGAPQISLLDSANLRDQAWIRGEPCAPPCWRQIQPGQTTIPQAYAILDDLETVIVIDANDTGILFADVDGEPCCQVLSDDEGVVDALLLQLAPGIVMGDVITRLGEPAFVTGEAHSESEALLSLVYPERGLLIGALVEGVNGPLSESSPIISAIMLSEATLARLLALTPLDDWKGYLAFSAYMDGEFDHAP